MTTPFVTSSSEGAYHRQLGFSACFPSSTLKAPSLRSPSPQTVVCTALCCPFKLLWEHEGHAVAGCNGDLVHTRVKWDMLALQLRRCMISSYRFQVSGAAGVQLWICGRVAQASLPTDL